MAFPIVPLVVLGVGVLVLRRRRRPAKKTEPGTPPVPPLGPLHTVVFIPPKNTAPEDPSGAPGQPCEATDGDGAWDDLGACKTFWIDGSTDEAIRQIARQEWEARGRPGFSEMCLMVEDPTDGELAAPKPNPIFAKIVAAALQRYYDVGPVFPPQEQYQFNEPTSPYWVHKAWAKATAMIFKELCTP